MKIDRLALIRGMLVAANQERETAAGGRRGTRRRGSRTAHRRARGDGAGPKPIVQHGIGRKTADVFMDAT